jgi:hypothetical protein
LLKHPKKVIIQERVNGNEEERRDEENIMKKNYPGRKNVGEGDVKLDRKVIYCWLKLSE